MTQTELECRLRAALTPDHVQETVEFYVTYDPDDPSRSSTDWARITGHLIDWLAQECCDDDDDDLAAPDATGHP